MMFLAHTAHWQFLGLLAGCLAWILTMTTAGINEWRLWHVADVSVVNSGVAWVGIWRACFYSHVLPKMENCQSINIWDDFVPMDIASAQVLMVLAVIGGLVGNISGSIAMRMAYFSVLDRRNIRLVFSLAGALYILTGTCTLVPLVWNMNSVLHNRTIDFPPKFHLPAAPARQQVGSAIVVGFMASILMLISGLIFLRYQYVWQSLSSTEPRQTKDAPNNPWTETTPSFKIINAENQGWNNPGFISE